MRVIIISMSFLLPASSFSQMYFQAYGSEFFKNLKENGLIYIESEDSAFDSSIEQALKTSWQFSSFEVVEKETALKEKTNFITRMAVSEPLGAHQVNRGGLAIVPSEQASNKDIERKEILGYMYYNGFYKGPTYKSSEQADKKLELRLHKMMIRALSDLATIIWDNHIDAGGSVLFSLTASGLHSKHLMVTGKRLIVPKAFLEPYDWMESFVTEKKLTSSGVNYKIVDVEEFNDLLDDPSPNDYVLYFASNQFTEVSVMSLLDGTLIYSKHLIGGYRELKGGEFKDVVSHFLK